MPEPPVESVAWARGAAKVRRFALPVSLLVGITAISGAFVAGNDAVCDSFFSYYVLNFFLIQKRSCFSLYAGLQGHAYNTFPKMGDTWIPDDIFDMKPLIRNFFENTSTVQVSSLKS